MYCLDSQTLYEYISEIVLDDNEKRSINEVLDIPIGTGTFTSTSSFRTQSLQFVTTNELKNRPQVNIKKPYCEKLRAKWAKKPVTGEKMLAFASPFSNFRDSFNHIKTAFRDGSIKLSIFNAKLYFTWIDYKHFIWVTQNFTTFIAYILWNFLKV